MRTPLTDREKWNGRLYIFSLLSIWMLFAFGYMTLWKFLNIDVEGVVISSKDSPSTGAPRYGTEYVIRDPDGQNRIYLAGPTDASLPRSMLVGTRISKKRWSVYYERDGRWCSFPFVFYSILLTGAIGFLGYAMYVKLTDTD